MVMVHRSTAKDNARDRRICGRGQNFGGHWGMQRWLGSTFEIPVQCNHGKESVIIAFAPQRISNCTGLT